MSERPTGFAITRGRGFHVTFENGWTVSVQFGPYNYRDGYPDRDYQEEPSTGWRSPNAEVAAWPANGGMINLQDNDTVLGWQSPAQVLALMVDIASRPAEASK